MSQEERLAALRVPHLVTRWKPFGPVNPPQKYALPIDKIHPKIHIVRRKLSSPDIPERMIVDHEIILIREGQGLFEIEGEQYLYGPNDLFFIPPFVPHRFKASQCSGDHYAVHFDFAPGVPDLSDDPENLTPYGVSFTNGLQISRRLKIPKGHVVEGALEDVFRHSISDDLTAPLAVIDALITAIIQLLRMSQTAVAAKAGGEWPQRARVQRITDFILSNYERRLSMADLAEAGGISVSRMRVLFQQVAGGPPIKWLNHIRIDAARDLLANSDLNIKEIARLTGSEDAYHFSRLFRQIAGVSPSFYRKAIRSARFPSSAEYLSRDNEPGVKTVENVNL